MLGFFSRLGRMMRRSPLETTLAVGALAVAVMVIVAPFAACRYPPMTDLPFHAAQTSAYRHYWDPTYHFREQFELHPLSVPYVSHYALGAALMLLLPTVTAMKVATAILLALVPAGLAVMFHGMKKSPLLGLVGLGITWGNLTQWGFINFMAALGLFCMVVGLTLMLLDRPSRKRQAALFAALFALIFTHVFRYPFALCAVVGTAIVMYPATRRFRPIVLPLVPAIVLFVIWWKIRPATLSNMGLGKLSFHFERFSREYVTSVAAGFSDKGFARAMLRGFTVAHVVALVGGLAAAFHALRGQRRIRAWDIGVTVVPLSCALVFFVLYAVLGMNIGLWWYVYPREAVAGTILLFGAIPNLPRTPWLRVPLVVAMAWAGVAVGSHVVRAYAQFDTQTADFDRITQALPRAPKLLYLVFDHGGSARSNTPFVHLPAWVQADKGGWLSWHLSAWGASPVPYRSRKDRGAVLPPATGPGWEWKPEEMEKPQVFNRVAPFFDWYLVRKKTSPEEIFKRDPKIQLVDHQGWWWLFKRKR